MSKIILSKDHSKDAEDMRSAYCESMIEMAEKDDRIVALDADLMSAMGMKAFAKNSRRGHWTAVFRRLI